VDFPSIPSKEAKMSLRVFMAICILGCDFMLYVLFQWMYGEKRRKHVHKSPPKSRAMRMQESRPYVVKPEKSEIEAKEKSKVSSEGDARTLEVPAA
jgi:hypothetical protein